MKRRVYIVYSVALFLVVIVLGRLVKLQVVDSYYKREAFAKSRNVVQVTAPRGDILDRDRNPLAKSAKIQVAYLVPENIPDDISESERDAIKRELMDLFSIDETKMTELMAKKGHVTLKRDLSQEEVAKVEKRIAEDSNDGDLLRTALYLNIESGRYYPSNVESKLIGFLDSEGIGAYGLEAAFEDELSGIAGKEIRSTGNQLEPVSTEGLIYPAVPGNSIVTTIDEGISNILYAKGKKAYEDLRPKGITLLAMDPNTGDILGMESFPTFDSNHPRKPLDDVTAKKFEEMNEEDRLSALFELWKNPAVSSLYEPGSVCKVLTLASALEERTTDDTKSYYCDGYVHGMPEDVDIRCWSWNDPHWTQNVATAFGNSCNPAFVQIGHEVGIDALYRYFEGFGIGQMTGVDLPAEVPGELMKKDDIGPVEFATMSFGHGLAMTPLQVATAVSAAVNGGILYTPRIVKETVDATGKVVKEYPVLQKRQVISAEASAEVRHYMEIVVRDFMKMAMVEGYPIGGKTGTTVKLEDGKYNENLRIHSFVSFYPVDAPKILLLIVIDESQADLNPCLALSQEIWREIYDYKKYEPETAVGE